MSLTKQCISTWQTAPQTTEMSTLTEQRIGSFETKANRQWTEVACPLSRRSWGGTRDKPKNVCVGGYVCDDFDASWIITACSARWTLIHQPWERKGTRYIHSDSFRPRMNHDIDNLFLFWPAVIWSIACEINQLTWLGWSLHLPRNVL